MSLTELIQLMESRLSALNGLRATAAALGDINQVIILDSQIEQTQLTLDQLRTLA